MPVTQTNPLATVRREKQISLDSLAEALGCNKGHLSRIERGEAQASPDLANRLAAFFDNAVTRDQILFPEDYPAPTRKTARSA